MATTTSSSILTTRTFLGYFVPELITASTLYIALELINVYFIACTDTALCNATLFITNALFHFITKVAEGFSIGVVVICGQYNGAGDYKQAGRTLSDALWTTLLIGTLVSIGVYLGAERLYGFYDAPPAIQTLGVPYVHIRAMSIVAQSLFLSLVGFLRAIKRPQIPMTFFLLGAVTYLICDYALIFGHFGLPALGLSGSALATVIQAFVMLLGAALYVLYDTSLSKYEIRLFSHSPFSKEQARTVASLIHVSWPIMIDKASVALIPVWLTKMMHNLCALAPQGAALYQSLTVLKYTERVGLLPALACAQMVTYVVSNDYKTHNFAAIKTNIKIILRYATILTVTATLLLSCKPEMLLWIFRAPYIGDTFIASTLPILAVLIVSDVAQLILAAALRGAADVQTVMMARLIGIWCIFMPLSYLLAHASFENLALQFMLLYSSVHISLGLISCAYVLRFKTGKWRYHTIQETD